MRNVTQQATTILQLPRLQIAGMCGNNHHIGRIFKHNFSTILQLFCYLSSLVSWGNTSYICPMLELIFYYHFRHITWEEASILPVLPVNTPLTRTQIALSPWLPYESSAHERQTFT